ncbi:MAG: type II toxin-antitoxin system mRNA interferase toxin, RelE/StbE family [Pseudobdellovibrionaceae bacterium]|jgi:proteic killer suppression protein
MKMVKISESKQAQKNLDKAPKEILRSYETWARMIESHGSAALRKFPGYHDEMLRGEWQGYRSSRLSLKWRVIYLVSHSGELEVVRVARVTAHDYRRK